MKRRRMKNGPRKYMDDRNERITRKPMNKSTPRRNIEQIRSERGDEGKGGNTEDIRNPGTSGN